MSENDALTELHREVQRAHAGERDVLSEEELRAFARRIRPDAECRIDVRETDIGAENGPMIVVRAVKRPEPSRLLEALSAREREVAALVARGMSNPVIARALGISPSTVKDHVHNILARLGLKARIELAVAVVREHERAIAERR